MDFYKIRQKMVKKEYMSVYPDFIVGHFNDYMVRGHSFYAIWDPDKGMWSKNEYDVRRLVDEDLNRYLDSIKDKFEVDIDIDWMGSYKSGSWREYRRWLADLPDAYHELDEKLTFSDTEVKRDDYVSKRLPYPLKAGSFDSYDELMSTLYDEDERRKIEWAIGSVVAGDSRYIQKFIVLYGAAGAGKSTVLNIIQELFEGYYTTFNAKDLASNSNAFSTEVFKSNPIVAIQHDGDLSRIEDNSRLNSIISHEEMTLNEKYKPSYTSRINCFLFMATNRPVRITDAKSGILRRLIDVRPSGRRLAPQRYQSLMGQIPFELGAIASHCLEVYRELGKDYYTTYRPIDMMFKTDVFFNFVEDSYLVFSKQDGCTLRQAYDMYKEYCDDAQVEYKMPKYKFREELKNYFREFYDRTRTSDGKQVRNYYGGFVRDMFDGTQSEEPEEGEMARLVLDQKESIFDRECADCPAQYTTEDGTPLRKWENVRTKLSDLDTTKLHYVRVPENHIVIDFDLKDESGEKSAELNLVEASKWPVTYAEYSKGGAGIHLHYIYDGDPTKLSRVYSDGIEIKVFTGNSSLRRRLSYCNDVPIAHINSGLPLKGEPKVINFNTVKSERGVRDLIERNLHKEIHPGTKPSVDFIKHILDEAYESGIPYDVSDLKPRIISFANNSTHQADYCLKLVTEMKFKSKTESEPSDDAYSDDRIVFFDVEVFPNLFVVNWKYQGEGNKCVRMINPTPQDIEQFIKMKLIGFNCRKYDNHILYARYLGYSNQELYRLSQRIVSGDRNAMFGEAYNISYTDVYDFASAGNKKSLKKWEIELRIHHQELSLPWDQPVPEDKWDLVAEYCDNDVISTEKVFDHLQGDFAARKILAKLSGLSVNDATNQHTTKIIFGNDRHPQSKFNYPNLADTFPGYVFDHGSASYMGEDPSNGGYVYSQPGMYSDVGLLDVTSLHPSSIENMNLFGPYTKMFSDIKQARVDVKHHEWDKARALMDGKLTPFIDELENGTASYTPNDLALALKTAINSVYGLTSAAFDNPFKDPRNKENIVAKRGALFMIALKHACMDKGWTVVHIKTDSIKLANITKEMVDFVMDFGKKYGYNFEHEATYDRLCIVNESVYIAHSCYGDHCGEWTATGAQFAQPAVFKTLFSKEPLDFEDKCETRSVTNSAIYLDFNEKLGDVSDLEKELKERRRVLKDESKRRLNPSFSNLTEEDLEYEIGLGHDYRFIGRVGSFCPVIPGKGGGILLRLKDGKYYALSGTKGYRWLEAEDVRANKQESIIDFSYYTKLIDEAVEDISQYGDFEWFINPSNEIDLPWCSDPENNDICKKDCESCSEKESCDLGAEIETK